MRDRRLIKSIESEPWRVVYAESHEYNGSINFLELVLATMPFDDSDDEIYVRAYRSDPLVYAELRRRRPQSHPKDISVKAMTSARGLLIEDRNVTYALGLPQGVWPLLKDSAIDFVDKYIEELVETGLKWKSGVYIVKKR